MARESLQKLAEEFASLEPVLRSRQRDVEFAKKGVVNILSRQQKIASELGKSLGPDAEDSVFIVEGTEPDSQQAVIISRTGGVRVVDVVEKLPRGSG